MKTVTVMCIVCDTKVSSDDAIPMGGCPTCEVCFNSIIDDMAERHERDLREASA